MIIKLISYIPAIIGVLGIALVIYSNDFKSVKNRLFVIVNLLIAFWLICLFIADISTVYSTALWAFRFGIFFAQLMMLFFYYFALVFPFNSRINLWLQCLISLPMILFAVLLLTPLGVQSVVIQSFGVDIQESSIIYNLSDAATLVYLLAAVGFILSKYKKSDITQRKQIVFVLIGLFIAVAANIFSGVIGTYFKIAQNFTFVGSFSLLIFSIFVTYAILKHHLFAIRAVVARSVAYTMSILATVGLYALIVFIASNIVFTGRQLSFSEGIFYATFSAITALAFQPVKKFFDKFSDRIFYRDVYNAQEFLNQINTKIVNTVDLYDLLNNIAKIISDNLRVEFCNFYIDEKSSIDFHVAGTEPKIFSQNDWEQLDKLIDQSNLKTFTSTESLGEEFASHMRKLKIDAVIKMVSQDQHVGYLIIGQKRSGNVLSQQDIQLVEVIADEVAIAVQNNLRFVEIAQFNVTLQKKIEIATTELQKSNEKLKALDEAKDEFISMASHQLRTPLTSVKGYISMMLEGDAGKTTTQQKDFLNQAYLSSQRMVYLIADLLNVSRLKTGKFTIDAKPTFLPDIVESEISQLTETVKARGLEMKFDKPKEFPTLNLDETKTRQVVMNFADNAIYYTPHGGLITIKLTAGKDTIEFTVTDTGIGVPKSEQHKLFTKFYRAGNAKKARPDGTGLGLFMAKKVIVAQGGAIIFKTAEGKGSTFGFSFPRSKVEVVSSK
jgi:signal transduction histidine kinase